MSWLNTFIALSKKQTRASMLEEHLKDLEEISVVLVDKRTPEQEAMWQEQLRIKEALGFKQGDNAQNWLRLHQVLLDHEARLKHVETQVGTRKGGGDEIV